jgi:hypothetical protein
MSDEEDKIAAEMTPDTEGAPDDAATSPVEGDAEAVAPLAVEGAPAPRSQEEIEALTTKLNREAEAHAKRVEKIMGDDFALLVPNPTDWTPGFIFNVPEMHPTPEQVAALHELLGEGPQVELLPAEDAEGCDKCNALGEVLTGSRKPGQQTKPCSGCNGVGWKTRLQMPVPVAQPTVYQNGSTTTTSQPNQFQVADRWGRPFGHPHYNLEPAAVS